MEESREGHSLEIFRQNFEKGLDDLLALNEEFPGNPLSPDPSSMGFDERTLEQLSMQELSEIRGILYQRLGINMEDPGAQVDIYPTNAPAGATSPGPMEVRVLKTNQPDLFLQEIVYQDRVTRWAIGPNQRI